ncbi:O-linked N-acetylglucosamine transferase family protein [Acidisoma sp. 7E03]
MDSDVHVEDTPQDAEREREGDLGWLDRLLGTAQPETLIPDLAAALRDMPLDQLIALREAQVPRLSGDAELALYRGWIEGHPEHPLLPAAWFNLGVGLGRQRRPDAAAEAYRAALRIKPDFHLAAVNLGLLYESQGQAELAITIWSQATQPAAARIALQTHSGRLLEASGRYAEAERVFAEILALDPTQLDVCHHWLHLRQKTCRWPVLPSDGRYDLAQSGPFGIMALTDDIVAQREAARRWIERKTSPAPRHLAPARPYAHERLRIGYLSSDFCSHAMAYLIAEVFERHDRGRFEVYGYCSTLEDGSAVRRRLLASFDQYRPIRSLSDEEAALLIREDEIDILVDLNGITDGSRLPVLRWRPAPIQATYLGFVGPIPLPELDYIFCDGVVIPPEHVAAYETKPHVLGPLYQANDSKRAVGAERTRAEDGLPADCFVYACFSKHYKITQEVFGAWMEILRRTPRAVLWLTRDNEASEINLRAEAEAAGIAPERLIFSERVDPASYMGRFRLADLFLDTFPYNAGTVASDALRMGLPIVTLCGRAFASRMATSLLHALDAHEGIATDRHQYVDLACRFAVDEAAHQAYRARITPAAWQETIGDTTRFMQRYEASLLTLAGRDQAASAAAASAGTPRHADALTAFAAGHARAVAGDAAGAIPQYRQALTLQPDFAEANLNMGTALLGLGRPHAAVAFYRKAIDHGPDNALGHSNLGKALHDLGRFAEAKVVLERAAALDPASGITAANLSATLMELGLWPQARRAAEAAVALLPDSVMAHCNLGKCLLNLGLPLEAQTVAEHAHALPASAPLVEATLGGLLAELGAGEAALPHLTRAVAAEPGMAAAWFNLSHALRSLNRLKEAVVAVDRAIALLPEQAEYHFHRAQLLLLLGEEAAGWAEYEWRWQMPNFVLPHASAPRWQGEPLTDRTLLVTAEQGLGDVIFAARYLPLLAAEAARVVVATPEPARRLLHSLPGVDIVNPADAAATAPSLYSPILSLPWALSRRGPLPQSPSPYLAPQFEERVRWRRRLPQDGRLNVGLVWAGNPAVQRDYLRSPGLAAVRPLFDASGVRFVILQKGPGREEIDRLALPPEVLDLGPEIGDLADTAAIMAELDLTLSSCTAPLHLAGALGLPAWGMIPFAPHFTWPLDQAGTPWYPSLRLYRQGRPGRDWSDVMTQILRDLQSLAASRGAAPAPRLDETV